MRSVFSILVGVVVVAFGWASTLVSSCCDSIFAALSGNHPTEGRFRNRARLFLEALEPRYAPAQVTVNTLADTDPNPGMVTLRAAIVQVNASNDHKTRSLLRQASRVPFTWPRHWTLSPKTSASKDRARTTLR